MKRVFLWMTLGVAILFASCQSEPVKVSVVATSDLETTLLAHDYKYSADSRGGCARLSSYLKDLKAEIGEQNVIYVDNGDMLPGWPINYYMNNVEKSDTTLAAAVMNLLGCEVYSIGEGDIAQGKELLSRHTKSMKGSAICANLVDANSGKLIYKPYTVVERGGMKIAFLGLITEWANKYMNAEDFAGLKVNDAEMAAKQWIEEIKKKENPDAIIGLFHMGASSISKRTKSREDMAITIARNVAGFDAIVCGHDGLRRTRSVESISGKKVELVSPGRRGVYAAIVSITAEEDGENFKNKKVEVSFKSMFGYRIDKDFNTSMLPRITELRKFIAIPVSNIKNSIMSADALFGSSAYLDIIHKVQLKNSNADLSIAHPYDFDEILIKGNVYPSDIQRICPYDGKLYTIKMTGKEIEEMLSYSVSRFYNTANSKNDAILKFDDKKKRLTESCRSLETVAGIRYNVNVNKNKNEGRLQILGLANGRKFDREKEYTVAVSEEYVMNTNLALNVGANIKQHNIVERVIAVSKKDLSELVLDYFKENESMDVKPLGNWSIQPAAWVKTIKNNEMNKLAGVSADGEQIDYEKVNIEPSKEEK